MIEETKIELRKPELDYIIEELKENRIDWKTVLQNHFGSIDLVADSQLVDKKAHELIKYTMDELCDSRWDLFHDGIMQYSAIHEAREEYLLPVGEIAVKLKNENIISLNEKETILRFLDPGLESAIGEYASTPHLWFWLAMGRGRPEESSYFDREGMIYLVPATVVRNILMFEMGAFFKMESYLEKESQIRGKFESMYPEESRQQDFSYFIQCIKSTCHDISDKIKMRHSIHQWLWTTYQSVLVNRLLNPKKDFLDYALKERKTQS